jgi:hypothetical protein
MLLALVTAIEKQKQDSRQNLFEVEMIDDLGTA